MRVLLLLAVWLALSACGQLNSRVGGAFNFDTDLKLVLEAKVLINPDENNSSSPVFLRLYELKSPREFEAASFMDLYQADAATLGGALLGRQNIAALLPGEARTERFVVDPATRYVGIFAEFYQYPQARAKLVVAVDSQNLIDNTMQVVVDGNQLSLKSRR